MNPVPVSEANECRQCCSFCDRVVYPSGCMAANCEFLYVYDDEQTGRRYMGCLNKVFKVEIDVELFREAERTRHGFGGVKMSGAPLARCRSSVERAYDGRGDAFECINPAFFSDAEPGGAPAFDLRDSL